MSLVAILAVVVSLNGEWKLSYWAQPETGAVRTLEVPASARSVPATVPGNCVLDIAYEQGGEKRTNWFLYGEPPFDFGKVKEWMK